MKRIGAIALVLAGLFGLASPTVGQQVGDAPALRLRASAEELLEVAYPERYTDDPDALEEDIEWVDQGGLRRWGPKGRLFI